jgi:hypothetical protein
VVEEGPRSIFIESVVLMFVLKLLIIIFPEIKEPEGISFNFSRLLPESFLIFCLTGVLIISISEAVIKARISFF